MKKTSLYKEHIHLKAKMAEFAGFEMPLQYTGANQEALAVRKAAGMFDVSHMGEFIITGSEVENFINFLTPNDYSKLKEYEAMYGLLCNEAGGILDDVIFYKLSANKAMLCVNAGNTTKDLEWISQHAKSFDVKVEDVSDQLSLLAVQGPEAADKLKEYFSHDLNIRPFQITLLTQENEEVIVARTGYTGEDGFEIFAGHSFIKKLWNELSNVGILPCGLVARDVLRIEAGYPLYGNELSEDFSPIDSGLKWTIKDKAEDYIGKKSLANTAPQFRSLKLSLDKGIPRSGYSVFNQNDEEIGVVTSGTMSVTINKGIAIARVDLNKYNSKDDVYIEIRGKKHFAHKHNKSFIVNGGS